MAQNLNMGRNMRKNFFMARVTEHWNWQPREVEDSPSMEEVVLLKCLMLECFMPVLPTSSAQLGKLEISEKMQRAFPKPPGCRLGRSGQIKSHQKGARCEQGAWGKAGLQPCLQHQATLGGITQPFYQAGRQTFVIHLAVLSQILTCCHFTEKETVKS